MENKSDKAVITAPEATHSDDESQAVLQWRKASEDQAKMYQIVRQMKEIAELPSETPKDVHPLKQVVFPDEGGVLTYMEGYAYPYKGFPFFEFVDKIDMVKKIQRATLSSLYHTLRRKKWKLILLPWLLQDFAQAYIYTFYKIVERFRIKTFRYSDAVRELHRAFSIEWIGESVLTRETRFQLRDVICMFLEMDNAYRYRFQDLIVELDKEALVQSPSKEIKRLLDILMDREKGEVRNSWVLAKFFLSFAFFFNRSLKRQIVGVLTTLDLSKVAMSSADKYFCMKREDYRFEFIVKGDPFLKEYEQLEAVESFKKEVTAENEAIALRQKEELDEAPTSDVAEALKQKHKEERTALDLKNEERLKALQVKK